MLTEERHFSITLVRKAGGAPEVCSAPTKSLLGRSIVPPVVHASRDIQVTRHFQQDIYPHLDDTEILECVKIAVPVSLDWEEVVFYEGFSLQLDGRGKALFVKFPRADGWLTEDFTHAIVALIELAEVVLQCDLLYVCVERDAKEFNSLVHSLMYVGFSVTGTNPIPNSNATLPQSKSNYFMLQYETE